MQKGQEVVFGGGGDGFLHSDTCCTSSTRRVTAAGTRGWEEVRELGVLGRDSRPLVTFCACVVANLVTFATDKIQKKGEVGGQA